MNSITRLLWMGARLALFAALLASCSSFISSNPPVANNPLTTPGGPIAPTTEPAPTSAGARPSATSTTAAVQPTPTIEFRPASYQAADCSYGGVFQSIEAVDVFTVRFRLCRSDVAFLSKIAFPAFSIYSREWLEQAGSPGFSLDAPVSSGPFQIAGWERGEKLTLKAFPDYWQIDRPGLQELVFRWETDGSLRLVELQARTADGIDALNPADFATVQADPALTLLVRPALNVVYLGMNNRHSPFDDERVRRAIALGIDRPRLLANAFPAGYEVARYFTPCAIPYGCEGDPFPDFNLEQARLLLAEAGFANDFPTELVYRNVVRGYLPWPDEVANDIKTQLWENLKIQVKLTRMEDEAFYAALDAGDLPGLYLLGWGADYPDADNFLGTHFGARATLQFGDPFDDVTVAVEAGAATARREQREVQYAAANTTLAQRVPMVPLAHGGWISPGSQAAAFVKDVQDLHGGSPFGLEDFSQLAVSGRSSLTWIQATEPLTLYCPLAEDLDTLRACTQLAETLYQYLPGSADAQPRLASNCQPDESFQTWTCRLLPGVRFHDGSFLDANDVAASFAVQWDADSALHKIDPGGGFGYFSEFWPGFLNANRP